MKEDERSESLFSDLFDVLRGSLWLFRLKSSGSERPNLEKPQETEWKCIAAPNSEQVVQVWHGMARLGSYDS